MAKNKPRARTPGRSGDDRAELLAKIKADFDDRLARMAAEPAQWIEFIDHVATFGALHKDRAADRVGSRPSRSSP